MCMGRNYAIAVLSLSQSAALVADHRQGQSHHDAASLLHRVA